MTEWVLQKKASDILFSKGKINARASSDVIPYELWVPTPEEYDQMLFYTLPQSTYYKTSLEGPVGAADYAFKVGDTRYRGSICRELDGYSAACRPLPKRAYRPAEIGLDMKIVRMVSQMTKGLVLVTGPTGSGKSSTICALIEYLNENYKYKMITLEDPIEYIFTPLKSIIDQREVGTHVDSYASGVRTAMRQAPNVIFVGEIRDLETVMAAMQAAETGHLVFATLHTEQVFATIMRIVDIAPHEKKDEVRAVLAHTLRMIIGQRLLRKVGGGVVAAREIYINIPAGETQIRRSGEKGLISVMQTNRTMGMVDWDTALKELCVAELIDEETCRTNLTPS